VDVYNPRRDKWDSSWRQDLDDENFVGQVEWEPEHLEAADLKIFYIDPATQSPVTLIEMGLVLGSTPERCIVCCHEGFWRRGNVLITARHTGAETANDLPELLARIEARLARLAGAETSAYRPRNVDKTAA
jgi:hypothetical protein